MHYYETDRAQLVAGLQWEVSSAGGYRPAQLSAKAKKLKAVQYLQHAPLDGVRGVVYGFSTLGASKSKTPSAVLKSRKSKGKPKARLGQAKTGKPVLSLASVVARRRSDSFAFLAPVSHDVLAYVLVLSGQPARELIADEKTVLAEVEKNFKGSQISAVCVSEELGAPSFELEGLAYELISVAPTDEDLRLAVLKKVPGGQLNLGALVLLFLALGGSGLGGAIWYHHKKQLELEQQAQQAKTPAQIYADNRQTALAALPVFRADEVGALFTSNIFKLPTEVSGWRMQKVECKTTATAAQCEAAWTPIQKTATYASFQRSWDGESIFSTTLNEVLTPVPLPKTKIDRVSVLKGMPYLQAFLKRDGSFFQRIHPLKLRLYFSKPVLVGGPPSPKVPGMVWQGQWAIHGPAYVLPELVHALAPNMALADVEVTLPKQEEAKAGPQFKAQGVFYVREK